MPEGPISNTEPGTTRASVRASVEVATVIAVLVASAPAGNVTFTAPWSAENVAPAGPTCAPSRTVIVTVPDFPSLVAVMIAVPGVNAVTSPLPETVATDVLLELQLTVLPVSAAPEASFGVAVSWIVASGTSVASWLTATLEVVETGCVVPESPLLLQEATSSTRLQTVPSRRDRAGKCSDAIRSSSSRDGLTRTRIWRYATTSPECWQATTALFGCPHTLWSEHQRG